MATALRPEDVILSSDDVRPWTIALADDGVIEITQWDGAGAGAGFLGCVAVEASDLPALIAALQRAQAALEARR